MEISLSIMENRYKLPPDIQKTYFQQIEKVCHINNKQLSTVFGVVSRTYRDWKRGKYTVPVRIVEQIEKKYNVPFPYSKEEALKTWFHAKQEASHIGGLARLQKHGRLSTPEGCAKGGKKALEILRARGIVPVAKPFIKPIGYSKELAEFIGILLGDGHLGNQQWSITINSIADKEYLPFITWLTNYLFSFSPTVTRRKNCNAFVIYGGGKNNISYFQQLGLLVGNKVKQQVGIPQWIQENLVFRKACLRGLMDTDGGIFIHKYKVNNKKYSYVKLCFVNRSIPILNFVDETLRMIELHPKLWLKQESKRVWLYDHEEVKQYLNIVGTHNPRLEKNSQLLYGGVR